MYKWFKTAFLGKVGGEPVKDREASTSTANQAEAEIRQGNLFLAEGSLQKAEECFRRAKQMDTHSADAYLMLGSVLRAQGRLMDAIAHFRYAALLKPDLVQAHLDMGELLSEQGDLDEAIGAYKAALSLRPDLAELHSNLGTLYRKRGRPELAEECYRESIRLKPDFYASHFNLGNLLRTLGRLSEAESCYQAALACNPELVAAHHNYGDVLKDQGRFEEAMSCYERALAIAPDYPVSNWHRTMLTLLIGDFQRGLPGYEYRWRLANEEKPRNFAQPLWLGDADIRGKTILLYAEKGFGDTIQFVRYVNQVKALGAKVILEVQVPLISLLSAYPEAEKVVAKGEPLPPFEYQCPLMSLPLAFKTEVTSIPALKRYISASPERAARWAAKVKHGDLPRVGIAWSGNIRQSNDQNRSMDLETLSPLISGTNAQFYSLVKDIRGADQTLLRSLSNITDLSTQLSDFAETAAIIENMDLVITVDTSVAHLACAMGKQTWIMLSFVPDWRWLLNRTDSPWYPSARLFRQPVFNDWDTVILSLQAALDQFCANKRVTG